MSFGCERSCSSPRRVSNFNSNVPQGRTSLEAQWPWWPHINLKEIYIEYFFRRALTSSGSTGGGGDAKTIISLNTYIIGSSLWHCIPNHSPEFPLNTS